MTLREKQSEFVTQIALLIIWVTKREEDWKLTFGDAARIDRRGHMPNSNHYIRLAIDLNLFVDGEWITDSSHPVWEQIGEAWEGMHPMARWGGRFGDGNHFSFEHKGVR